ncbi:MAG: nucleotidyltransferase family protein [Candidatus Omnitrophica bacterium]|nr:nucleotidyltransferase family protein [Candidatus Omnitrophota bacterium]
MLNKKIIRKAIQDNLTEIKSYGIKRIGFFGSFARSSQNKESDIDVLVEFYPEKKSFDNYMELKFFLEKLLRRKVDLVIKDAIKPRIKPRILNEVLYA